jgi:hypothetical protein
MEQNVKDLATWIIETCGVEGIRNNGGKWQRVNDENQMQMKLERKLDQYLRDTEQTLELRS